MVMYRKRRKTKTRKAVYIFKTTTYCTFQNSYVITFRNVNQTLTEIVRELGANLNVKRGRELLKSFIYNKSLI